MADNRSGHAIWRRSAACDGNECLEVAFPEEDKVLIRHSRMPEGPIIHLNGAEWDAFLLGVAAGEFQRPWKHRQTSGP